nr:DUF4238 domain-containing protein [Paenibacillus sp. GP183]
MPIENCAIRNFHTVETLEGKDSRTFEEAFSLVEENASRIIKNINATFMAPEPGTDDYNWLINFIAILCERTPARRKHFSEMTAEMYKMITRVGFQHKEYFESQKRIIEEKTGEKNNLTHEKLLEFIERDEYEVVFGNNHHMKSFMDRLDVIIEPLSRRKWSVVTSPPMMGDFICSDNPVCLRNVTKVTGFFSSPGHGMFNTEVSLPLSPRVVLLGRFEDYHPMSGLVPNRKTVAAINSFTGMYAEKFIFSKKQDFLWTDTVGKLCNTDDFKRKLVEKKEKPKE